VQLSFSLVHPSIVIFSYCKFYRNRTAYDSGRFILFIFVQFFRTKPYACEPWSLPKYTPSKEMDAKLREDALR